MELLEFAAAARTLVYSQPLVVFGAVLLIGTTTRVVRRVGTSRTAARLRLPEAALAAYVISAAWYLLQSQFADHIEASVAAISWDMLRGQPLYPSEASAAQYGLPYGPLLFLTIGLALAAAGPSIVAAKMAGCAGALGSILLLRGALGSGSAGRTHLGLLALGYLAFGPMTFWTRAEPFLLLLVAANWAVIRREVPGTILLTGVLLGLAANLKITAVFYFLPSIAWLIAGRGYVGIPGLLGVAVATFAAPFLLLSTVSFEEYASLLRATSQHGIRPRSISQQMQWAVLLFVPSLVAMRTGSVQDETVPLREHAARLGLALGLACMVPVAAKYGAGPHHFIPFLPAIVALGNRQVTDSAQSGLRSNAIQAMAVTALLLATVHQASWMLSVSGMPGEDARREVERYVAVHRESVGVGFSGNYRAAWTRVIPVFQGNRYWLDAPSLMDRQVLGLEFPETALDALKRCEVRTWIIPRGGRPFELPNVYLPGRDVFPESFVTSFHERYQKVDEGRFYDVWQCRP